MAQTELQDKVDALEILVPNLVKNDKSFANSLVDFYKRKGTLSPKQEYWVRALSDRAMNKGESGVPEPKQVGNFSGVYALFEKAKVKLKFPKIYMEVESVPVVISMAGERAKVPGVINVAGEGEYMNRKWYGSVSKDGTWSRGFKTYEDQEKVESLLRALSRNPAKAAKEYGTLTGRCCFCGKHLKDEHSTAAGFGPVCADNFGLTKEWKSTMAVLTGV